MAGFWPYAAGRGDSTLRSTLFRIRNAPQNVSVVGRSVWLGDSHRLLINVGDGRISLMDSLSKKTREVLSILPEMISDFRLSRDGRQIFFVRSNRQSDIYMLSFK